MLRFALFSLFFSLSLTAHAQVWTDTNTWSQSWEDRYSDWVAGNWNVEMFSKTTLDNGRANPYYGLRADCADTVYSMRMIFAYENRLPFAVLDPTGSGRLITNRMTRFNSVKDPSERFRRFARAMYDTIATATMPNDTFPVALTPRFVRAGAAILTTKKNHHSWSVKQILPIGVPWLVFNSVVSSTSSLVLQERQSWPNPYWVFEGDQSPAGFAGFRAFRPIPYIGQPVWSVPGYSEEQYNVPLSKWQKLATTRLASRRETDEQQLNRLLSTACSALKERIKSVNEGVNYLRRSGGGCMDYATYDNYSTPNRDQRLFDDMVALRIAFKDVMQINGAANVSGSLVNQLKKIYPRINSNAKDETAAMKPQSIDGSSVCSITYAPGRTIDFAEAKRRIFAGLFSNNPLDEIEYRWGEARGPSTRARSCPSWSVWTPNLNQAN